MLKVLCLVMLTALSSLGCKGVRVVPTEAMPIKQMHVNDVDFAYVEEGTGTTVLFVHGASADWRAWDGLRPYIAPKYRFVSMSRRYHYPNQWADDGERYTFDQHVEDIAAFVRGMHVGRVHLVGNSYSGRLVGVVALKYPELVRSVVLGESGLVAPESAEGRAAAAAYGRDLAKVSARAKAGDGRQAAILLANAVLANPEGFNKMSPAHRQRWLDNAKTLPPMFRAPPAPPVACEKVKELMVPALAVRGENTRDNFKFGHDALLSCLPPTGEGAIVPSATHQWDRENPAGAASVILPFIARH